jgi:hypothetical protein
MVPGHRPGSGIAGGKLENTLIAPNSIPVDQPWAEIIPRPPVLDERLKANITGPVVAVASQVIVSSSWPWLIRV